MSAVVDSFALLDALVAGGVRHLVLCPGSRSAPLAYAAAAWEEAGALRIHPRVDERAAGFYALGLARSTGAPAAVLMTSGTAVPHLYPAVVEAAHTGTPLLVVSADRPWELRGVGASQTTTQVGMFTPHLRHSLDLPAGLGVELGQDDSLRRVSNVVGRA
ncbi:MAG: thiamine pyrophosphate-binding protein, partial [Actinomycetaceae bacterium]|nr:thiamine pyrophosphate-binding protein [Actinomycetaceae bacterium]